MPNFGRYIIDADTFANATTITDPVTGVTAPDGVYQYGGVYRVMTGGILSSVLTSCPSCCVDCGTTTFVIGLTKNDYHEMCANVGESANTAIKIRFKMADSRLGYMQGFQAEYDGFAYNGVISNRYGYLEKKYVGNVGYRSAADIVADSPYTLSEYAWQSGSFNNVSSNIIEDIELSDINQQTTTSVNIYNNPDECYMLIPKISLSANVKAEVFSPKATIDSSGGACDVDIYCPSPLYLIQGTSVEATKTDACSSASASGTPENYYVFRVNSTSGAPRLFDRIYLDAAGVTPLTTAGYYAIENQYSGSSSDFSWIKVDSDGIVQAAGDCGSPMLTEMISSEVRGTFWQACEYQNINGGSLPDQQYWHNGTGDAPQLGDKVFSDVTGVTNLPDGWYQLMREYIRIEVSLGTVTSVQTCTI